MKNGQGTINAVSQKKDINWVKFKKASEKTASFFGDMIKKHRKRNDELII